MNPGGVIVAGGSGTRFGRLKQLEKLGSRRVLDWSVEALRSVCQGIVVVLPVAISGSVDIVGVEAVVAGGIDRSASVRAGLAAVPIHATHVLVHDAARPLASTALAQRVIDTLQGGAAAVVPVVAVRDSLRTIDGEPVDRSRYVMVQTPQGFDADLLREAHASGPSATDDVSLFAALGIAVRHVEGEDTNLKITESHDLAMAEVLAGGL